MGSVQNLVGVFNQYSSLNLPRPRPNELQHAFAPFTLLLQTLLQVGLPVAEAQGTDWAQMVGQ